MNYLYLNRQVHSDLLVNVLYTTKRPINRCQLITSVRKIDPKEDRRTAGQHATNNRGGDEGVNSGGLSVLQRPGPGPLILPLLFEQLVTASVHVRSGQRAAEKRISFPHCGAGFTSSPSPYRSSVSHSPGKSGMSSDFCVRFGRRK